VLILILPISWRSLISLRLNISGAQSKTTSNTRRRLHHHAPWLKSKHQTVAKRYSRTLTVISKRLIWLLIHCQGVQFSLSNLDLLMSLCFRSTGPGTGFIVESGVDGGSTSGRDRASAGEPLRPGCRRELTCREGFPKQLQGKIKFLWRAILLSSLPCPKSSVHCR
jgi:hypothetical protein